MRRRPPHLLHLSPGEVAYLKTLVEDGRTEQRVARRTRVLLAMTDPDTVVSELADRLELERTTNNGECLRAVLPQLLGDHCDARRIHLIWASRDELIKHLDASWPEYNRFHAHPFTWSWTRAKMHSWVDCHLP
jgi:hypothetical protein